LVSLEELKGLCQKGAKAIAVFGSYVRAKDYVEGISDLNVFALTRDKQLLLELASMGYSPVMLGEESLRQLCEAGDPLCYYVLYDSKVLCGSLPRVSFKLTDGTCRKLRDQAINSFCFAIESHFRSDELNSVRYAFKAIKLSVAYRVCRDKNRVIVSNDEAESSCKELNLAGCSEMKDLLMMMRLKLKLTTWALDRIAQALTNNLDLPVPTASDLMRDYGDYVAKLVYDNGVWRVLLKDGKWDSFKK